VVKRLNRICTGVLLLWGAAAHAQEAPNPPEPVSAPPTVVEASAVQDAAAPLAAVPAATESTNDAAYVRAPDVTGAARHAPPPPLPQPPATYAVGAAIGSDARPARRVSRTADGRVALALGGVLLFSKDPGFDFAFEGNRQRGIDAAASCDVFRPVDKLNLALGASVRRFVGESEAGQVHLRTLNATADVSLRYELLPVLPVFVRAAFGFASAEARIDTGARSVTGSDIAPLGQIGAGVVLQTAPGWFESPSRRLAKLTFGLTVEGGMGFGPALAPRFDATTSYGTTQYYPSLGKLDATAPYLRLLGTLRF
jgi:hypothetical protein